LNATRWAGEEADGSFRQEGAAVSAEETVKNKAEAAKGTVKKNAGKAIGDPYLEGEGKADEMKGDLKQAGNKVKDAFTK
jgi:uncharacterized protein YjbJ (UPF0337 family)